jgi:hypothetical protein
LLPAGDSASAQLIQAKGNAHELAFLDTLKGVQLVDKAASTFEVSIAATRSVLHAGAAWIYQAALAPIGVR